MIGADRGKSGQGLSMKVVTVMETVVGRWGWINERGGQSRTPTSRAPETKGRTPWFASRTTDEESGRCDHPLSSTGIGLNRQKPVRFLVALPDVDGGP